MRRSNRPHINSSGPIGGRGDALLSTSPHKITAWSKSPFGSNPGTLKAWLCLPSIMAPDAPLVVALHGAHRRQRAMQLERLVSTRRATRICGALSRAAAIEQCQPLLQLVRARRHQADAGEALSIRQMIGHLVQVARHRSQAHLCHSLSAGGAMANVMLSTYPDIFAGGAIISGLPYGVAGTVVRRSSECKAAIRRLSPGFSPYSRAHRTTRGFWPSISIWHGTHDQTVRPGNADQIVKQWSGVTASPRSQLGAS